MRAAFFLRSRTGSISRLSAFRLYLNETSPLGAALARYADYFRLFGHFRGYVEFFLLQDLVTDDCSAVKFFSPFEDFNSSRMCLPLARRSLCNL